ncbi:hypothetical protein LXA43DRAFT_1058441 [Ganoderma leucocontextum]|nr:hypothetical protein LXA43DRAFT_1058441 [Ganoderma leucocontextum]
MPNRPLTHEDRHQMQLPLRPEGGEYLLTDGDKCFKLIVSRINDWRSNFSLTAIATFRQILGDLEEQDPKTFSLADNKAAYAQYLLGDAKTAAPFYWAEWNDGEMKKGRLQGPIILGAFASHLEELETLSASDRTQEHASGALAMAVLATGDWRPPKGRAGWFSYENYADTPMYIDGKMKMDKRLSRVTKVVSALSEAEWDEIQFATNEIINQRKAEEAKGGKRRRSGKKAVANAQGAATGEEAADGHASDDSDLMLIADE